jgi:hypothetical protein
MKISVVTARAFASALNAAADAAMAKGEHEFDLIHATQAVDNAAREELEQAIAAAKAAQG